MNNTITIKGFSEISEKELLDVDGGWWAAVVVVLFVAGVVTGYYATKDF